jgi:hypothetical protein
VNLAGEAEGAFGLASRIHPWPSWRYQPSTLLLDLLYHRSFFWAARFMGVSWTWRHETYGGKRGQLGPLHGTVQQLVSLIALQAVHTIDAEPVHGRAAQGVEGVLSPCRGGAARRGGQAERARAGSL